MFGILFHFSLRVLLLFLSFFFWKTQRFSFFLLELQPFPTTKKDTICELFNFLQKTILQTLSGRDKKVNLQLTKVKEKGVSLLLSD